jgi:hypothetical protein
MPGKALNRRVIAFEEGREDFAALATVPMRGNPIPVFVDDRGIKAEGTRVTAPAEPDDCGSED